ncbi:MAG: T9SS type A sorting domain-containing protein [Flavobacterium sp.]|nr:T9SS type A sorting domain-containing protein [Flavobacterium sp.]
MKKLFLFIVCFSFNFGISQIINIPDPAFKSLLINSSSSINTAFDCVNYNNYKIDINNNGEIEESEALLVCTLFINTPGIFDLTGIEFFSNLTFLGCFNNNVTNLDVSQLINLVQLFCGQNNLTNLDVSQNINLHLLACTNNNLTSLNVSQLTQLEGLNVRQNQLTILDISNLSNLKTAYFANNQINTFDFANTPMLEKVFCSNNQLTSLDFRSNPLFNELDCMNNPNLSDVNISNGTTQLFGPQTYYNQCWSGCPNLAKICADSNEMSALQTYLTSCGIDISSITFNTNCVLANEEFGLEEVAIYPNPAVDNVNITSNENIKTVELIDIQGRMLQSKTINKLNTNIDISGYINGDYFVKVTSDKAQSSYKLIKN